MKKSVYLVALAVFVLLTIHLFRETRRLRSQVQQLEGERDQAILAEFRRDWRSLPEEDKARVVGIYNEVAQAYANRDAMGMLMSIRREICRRVRRKGLFCLTTAHAECGNSIIRSRARQTM